MSKLIVYYHQLWLPNIENINVESNLFNVKSFREVEVILEPNVLFLCLLRKVWRAQIVFKPCLYDRFYNDVLPASLTNNLEGKLRNNKVEGQEDYVLRNEELINGVISTMNSNNSTEVESEFSLYTEEASRPENRKFGQWNLNYLKNDVVLVSYIYSHLRHCILYLIWLHPILNAFTFSVLVNSEPLPFAYYSFLKKKVQVKKNCNSFGYSNLSHTLRDLDHMLHCLRLILSNKFYNNYPLNDVYWFEGYVFSNLTVLFSLPCKDLDDILSIHREFQDLKSYCVKMNSRHDVVALKAPFLTGDEVSMSHFSGNKILKVLNYIV